MLKRSRVKLWLGGMLLPAAAGLMLSTAPSHAQNPSEIKIGLLVPLSGIYARPGAVMRMGAEMAIEDINAQGGAYLKTDFSAEADPLEHTRRILGLDRIAKRRGRGAIDGDALSLDAIKVLN